MIGRTPIRIAFVTLTTFATASTTAAPGFADSSSKSRAAVRHDTTSEPTVETTASRSKVRRGTRSAASDTEIVVQKRSKRSKRGRASEVQDTPQIAQADDNGLALLAESGAAALSVHVETASFEGTTGALALYQLTGKAIAKLPMTAPERAALANAVAGTDLSTLVRDTEARLIDASGPSDSLDGIAKALGIPRPDLSQPMPNLGAALSLRATASEG